MFQEVCHNNVSTWSFQLNFEKFKPSWQTYEEKYVQNQVASFWENPKTDSWSQIIWIPYYQKNNRRSKKGSFTMTRACPGAPCDEKNRGGKKQKTDTHGEDN